jgi:hypothetical protein
MTAEKRFNDKCVVEAIRKGRTLIGPMSECGFGPQTIDYIAWFFSILPPNLPTAVY